MSPKLPSFDAKEAERLLFQSGFELTRAKGSHKIYMGGKERIVIPFHSKKTLHPKIIIQVLSATQK